MGLDYLITASWHSGLVASGQEYHMNWGRMDQCDRLSSLQQWATNTMAVVSPLPSTITPLEHVATL